MGPQVPGAGQRAKGGPATAGTLPPAVCSLLSELLGRKVASKKIAPYPFASALRRIVVAYEAEDHSVAAICVCDFAFASYAGAALAMIPAGIANESLAAGKCDPAFLENFTEILNIGRQWFQGSSQHILPPQLYLTRPQIPPHIAAVLSAPNLAWTPKSSYQDTAPVNCPSCLESGGLRRLQSRDRKRFHPIGLAIS